MSHVAKVDLEVKDLDSLKKACEELGLEFRENQKTWKWYGTWVNDYHGEDAAYRHGITPEEYGKCDHAIGIKGNKDAYEIGVKKTSDGSYVLAYDFWGGGRGLEQAVGKGANRLKQSYAKQVVKKRARRMGYSVKQVKQKDGSIRLKLNR